MARKPTTTPKNAPRERRISLIGAKSKYIGRVEAADAEAAIDKAMEEFRIEPARRFRLTAEPVEPWACIAREPNFRPRPCIISAHGVVAKIASWDRQ